MTLGLGEAIFSMVPHRGHKKIRHPVYRPRMTKFESLDLLKVGNTIQLVGAVWAGEGEVYLCMFPSEHGEVLSGEVHVLNMTREQWQQFLRQTDILEAEVLAQAADGTVTKAILRKSARQISQHISWEVFRRDGYACRYCGKDTVPLTVDHLVTWEMCGPSVPENLVSSCKKCNKVRGDKPYAEWLQHDYYQKVSQNLSALTRQDNEALLDTLDDIPRMIHKPTQR